VRSLLALLTSFALLGVAHAQPIFSFSNKPIRLASGQLVRVGDSVGQVLLKAGRAPDRETALEPGADGAVGRRWIYIEPGRPGRIVTVELRGGRVARLRSEKIE
jgi:hypothetical protein